MTAMTVQRTEGKTAVTVQRTEGKTAVTVRRTEGKTVMTAASGQKEATAATGSITAAGHACRATAMCVQ